MYGAKVYRCAPEQVKHVDSEVVELASWLPVALRTWKSTVRERGAGNLVELDKDRRPPEEEREDGDQQDGDTERVETEEQTDVVDVEEIGGGALLEQPEQAQHVDSGPQDMNVDASAEGIAVPAEGAQLSHVSVTA